MAPKSVYGTPGAFRSAVTDRIKERASSSPWTVQQLQRQFTYDRLLERLYLVDDSWILKGATALLARGLGVRGSLDIDIYRDTPSEIAESDLRRAAQLEVDWMVFEIGPSEPIGNDDKALRVPVVANIGATEWAAFSVDLIGSDLRMTGQPDAVPSLVPGIVPDVSQRGYRAYPLVDHIADKVAATYELYGPGRSVSTRYRDLIDLVAIATGATIEAQAQNVALKSEFERRAVDWPQRFVVPDEALWAVGYAAEARRSVMAIAATLDEALEIVCPFIDPLFAATAAGVWSPSKQAWMGLET